MEKYCFTSSCVFIVVEAGVSYVMPGLALFKSQGKFKALTEQQNIVRLLLRYET